jgi:hypothetical protein
VNLFATAFPNSRFTWIDISEEGIEAEGRVRVARPHEYPFRGEGRRNPQQRLARNVAGRTWKYERRAGAVLLDEPVLHERPQGGDAVAPRDLLALVYLASGVGDRHLVDADPAPKNLGGELGLEVEALGP